MSNLHVGGYGPGPVTRAAMARKPKVAHYAPEAPRNLIKRTKAFTSLWLIRVVVSEPGVRIDHE